MDDTNDLNLPDCSTHITLSILVAMGTCALCVVLWLLFIMFIYHKTRLRQCTVEERSQPWVPCCCSFQQSKYRSTDIQVEQDQRSQALQNVSRQKEIDDYRKEVGKKEKQIKKLQNRCNDYTVRINALDAEINQVKEDLITEKQQHEDVRNKYSAIVSSRLRDNNPNIVDLSDPNRPVKLGEQFSELYDNEWTSAYEYIFKNSGKIQDKEIEVISFLLKIITISFTLCKKESSSQLEEIRRMTETIAEKFAIKNTSLCDDFAKKIKDERRMFAAEQGGTIAKLTEDLMKKLPRDQRWKDVLGKPRVEVYATACVRLSWLMALRDPPMAICFDRNSNTAMFRPYLVSGNRIDYVVWPALLLHDNGQLVTKGTAQFHKN